MGGREAKFCNKKCVFMLEAKGNGSFLTKVPILLFSPRQIAIQSDGDSSTHNVAHCTLKCRRMSDSFCRNIYR